MSRSAVLDRSEFDELGIGQERRCVVGVAAEQAVEHPRPRG